MELFKLFGTIAVNGIDEAGKQLEGISKAAFEVGDKFSKVGSNFEKVGKKMLPVTAAIGGIATAAVKTTADFDASMSKVSAISGATGDDLEALRQKAKEMGSTTKFSASESAEAMQYMAMAGWETGQMIDGIAGIMNLAAASGEDLGTTSDIVTDALTAFGLEAADAGHFADILATASSSANTNVSMMGETFKYVAPVAGALGYSAEDVAQAIGLMANAGIKGSQAGTALRSMFSRLAAPPKECADAMDALGLSITNEDGSMKSLNEVMEELRESFNGMTADQQAMYAKQIAGQEAMSGLLSIVNASEKDWNKLSNEITHCSDTVDGFEGSAARMAATMNDNLSGKMIQLKSQLEGASIQLGEIMIPTIEKVVEKISEWVTAFSSLDSETQQNIIVIAGIIAAVAPVLIIIGKMASGIGALIKVVTLFNVTLAANPILVVIMAITALISIGVALYKNWDVIKEKASALFGNLSEKWNNLKEATAEKWNNMKESMSQAMEKAKEFVHEKAEALKEGIQERWNNLKENAAEAWGNIRDTMSDAMESAKQYVSEKLDNIKAKYEEHGGGLKGVVGAYFETLKQIYSVGYDAIDKLTGGKLSSLVNMFKEKFENAKQTVHDAIEKMKSFFHFEWSLPHIKMPHFSISGSFSLNPPSVPSFGVEWYKKAMDTPMIMESPTAFGINSLGQIMAGGEAGSEVVSGTNTLMSMISDAVAVQNNGVVDVLVKVLDAILLLDENMGENLREALESTSFQVNNREFARLVKAVN